MVAAKFIRENERTLVDQLEPSDATHIRNVHDTLTVEVRDDDVYLTSPGKVGAIGVPSGASFYIQPKVDCSLLHMLALSNRLDDEIAFDAEEASFDFGDSFVDLIAQLFIHELRRIVQRGLNQEYQERAERLNHLRGRLDLQRQLRQGPGTTAFECAFDELTHDTPANHLLYQATDTLRSVVSNDEIVGQLHRYCHQLEAAFEPQPLPSGAEIDLQLTHLDRYYERGIELAKFVLQEHYVQGFAGQRRDLSSFMVDIPTTFEKAVSERVDSALSSTQYEVTTDKLGTLAQDTDTGATRDLVPDFTIYDKITEEVLLVGDAKWKDDDGIKREDLYQMFAYQTKAQAPGLLIYPDASQQLPSEYEFQTGAMGYSLFVHKLDISANSFEETKRRIDRELREAILGKLDRPGVAAPTI